MTEIQLILEKSFFVIPLEDLTSPLCVVPNAFTRFRMNQDDKKWLAINQDTNREDNLGILSSGIVTTLILHSTYNKQTLIKYE